MVMGERTFGWAGSRSSGAAASGNSKAAKGKPLHDAEATDKNPRNDGQQSWPKPDMEDAKPGGDDVSSAEAGIDGARNFDDRDRTDAEHLAKEAQARAEPSIEPTPDWEEQHPPHGSPRKDGVASLPFTTFEACKDFTSKPWILKGLIARGDISSWIAPPMGGKSTLLDWLFIHCAQGIDWCGHRAKEMCGVVIFALERSDQHKAHMRAYQMRDGLKDLPIVVVDTMVDLCSPQCIGTIVATVRAVEQTLGVRVGVVAFDTFNKGIAINGDEDKARDQNKCAANLRQVQREIDVHIAMIGHTGKNEERGARGSNAHLGDVDVMIQIFAEGAIRTARITAANEQPIRDLVTFCVVPYSLGTDEDGDAITVGMIEVISPESKIGQAAAARAKKTKLTPAERVALDALAEVMREKGREVEHVGLPGGVKVVNKDVWREKCIERGISGGDRKAALRAFERAFKALNAEHFLGVADPWVWMAD